jgi:Zn-dependent M28 family amino/carboxypeptidase
MQIVKQHENQVVFVDESFSKEFGKLTYFKRNILKSAKSIVFVLGNYTSDNFEVTATHEINEQQGTNVIGILPGKSRKSEYVIYSGHYDHLGVGKPVGNDSIFNGANDDASGVTGIIMAAKYYQAAKDNERTLIFVAFTAEEIGGFGSQYFSQQIDPAKAVAMLNLEMVGTESKWGKNSAYITGFDKSDLGPILQKNLLNSKFNFHPDPYPEQELFYRSDNATLAHLGVPAHTISTSKMDNEPNYHKVSDEVGTLDLDNMTEIIKAVVVSAKSIVSGVHTPTRVKGE